MVSCRLRATDVSKPSRDRKGVPHGPDGPPNRMRVSGTHSSELSRDRKGADVPGTAAIRSLTVAARSLAWVTFNGAVAEVPAPLNVAGSLIVRTSAPLRSRLCLLSCVPAATTGSVSL